MARQPAGTAWMGPLPATPGCDCHVCRPDAAYDEIDRSTIDTVLRHGWQVMLVSASVKCSHPDHQHDDAEHDDHDDGPEFAYTVGLGHRYDHPELLVSGLDPALMHRMLNHLAQQVASGRRLTAGDVLEDVLTGVPVVLEQVADDALRETVVFSGWFHRRRPEALVVLWPDRAGVFAWQPGAPAALDELQPRRWQVPQVHTGAAAPDPAWGLPLAPDDEVSSCTHVVDDGEAVLWVGSERDGAGRHTWTVHCGAGGHRARDLRTVHLAHLVRAAPGLRGLSGLGPGDRARRADAASPWVVGPS